MRLQGQDEADDAFHLPAVDTHLIRSRHVAQIFKIQVARPPRRRSNTARLPVVYATDGNICFDMFRSISCNMHLIAPALGPDAPPYILVGIGYPGDSPFAGHVLRIRDFTFPPFPELDVTVAKQLLAIEDVLIAEQGTKELYGAEDFRRFIGEELIPFIDETYETVSGDRTYFGHSGGGYFGLFTLFTHPELFKNYIVSSPGLIYTGEMPGGFLYENIDCGLQMARAFIASGRSLQSIKLYMSVGTEEEFEPGLAAWQMTSGFYRMAKLLKSAALPGLEFMAEALLNETHGTTWPIAFMHGVQAVFGKRRIGGVY